ncbi:TetR/AcrR family transcriptional regulator [Fodinicola acaciae]|uniref:TetR/AcrR family transcriptional regulator n=1 Tax=Fodinicola acaciae TaxID=2681555 RepID=UPI0013D675D5|nr:TetR family transcriptional regulator [Fodinicola acaciae]
MEAQLGRREQRKRETRQHIADSAMALFVVNGFDNVTVTEIAEHAGVSRMTVFNYFPRKEDIFFDRIEDGYELSTRAIRDRRPGESIAAAARRLITELAEARHPLTGLIPGGPHFWNLVSASPALKARVREAADEWQSLLARLIAEETGAADDDPAPLILAAELVAMYRLLHRAAIRWIRSGRTVDEVAPDYLRLIDRAFDAIESGIGPYGVVT